MSGHEGAIAQYLIPMLLAVLCALASYGLYMHKEFMHRNEREHDRFSDNDAAQATRLTRVETRVEHLESDVYFLREGQHGR